jgi:predicted dehydrogenase
MLEVVVVGAGRMARAHLAVLQQAPEVRVAALVDPDAAALQRTADEFGIARRLASHRDLLQQERPDAAFVAVSILSTADVAADFLSAGVPTLVEKPAGLFTHQTRRLAELARERRALAMVGVNRRFYAAILRGRELLAQAGPVLSITVDAHEDLTRLQHDPRFPAQVVRRWGAANGVHVLDLLRFFAGDVARVCALQRTFRASAPDVCAALLEFEGGAVGRAGMDFTGPGGHRFEVRAEGATLTSQDSYLQRLILQARGSEPLVLQPDELDRTLKPGLVRQDHLFLECVRTGTPLPFPASTLDDAVKTMELIDALAGA